MRMTLKLCSVLLLSSTLGACSMAGVGELFSGKASHHHYENMSYDHAMSSGCDYVQPCAGGYTVGQPVETATYDHTPYMHAPAVHGHGAHGQHIYEQTVQTQPSYGQVQAVPAYTAPTAYPAHELRGSKPAKDSYFYGSLGAVQYDVDSDLYGAQARLGWQSKSIFGAEVEGSLGFTDDDTLTDFGSGLVPATFEVDNQVAAFTLARLPLSSQLNLIGRYGYHHTSLSTEAVVAGTEFEDKYKRDGIAYGVGAEYAFSPRTSVRADYTRYDFDGADTDAVSLAVSQKF